MDLPYTLTPDRQIQLALIVLQSDETLEYDMRRLLPADVEMLVSRVASGAELSTETIAAMESRLTEAASLLPRAARIAAAGYGCTSASAQFGSARVADLIREGVETPHATDPAAALIAACRALGVQRIALVSPYVASISDRMRAVLSDAGIATPRFGSFNEPVEGNVVRIAPASLRDAALKLAGEGTCDAVFLSCTNLRTLDVIGDIEKEIGMPVMSSNQVLAWHMLRLAGIAPVPDAPGTLWRRAGLFE
ncbi:Asp/Glu racemase [Marimonas sp. MJW-29]|uniref:Asp/Glu racemase n=1 Tax=Sulfitobacter sediminis TaxID=3234186 RepID=A0ABV3RMG9_9RHOB